MSNHDPNMAHTDAGHSHAEHAHDDPSVYLKTLILLLILTVITVGASYVNFGSGNTAIALFIATIKATLVALFFMHLAHDKKFNSLTFISAFLFLGIFIVFTYDDLGRRAELDNDYGGTVDLQTGQAAPGGLPATTATINDVEEEPPKGEPAKKGGGAPAGEKKE